MEGTCRVCFEDMGPEDDGCCPCDCKENGMLTVAHKACIQQWIDLRPNLPTSDAARRDPGLCEVCGVAWKQEYTIPAPMTESNMPTRAQMDERAMLLLISAFARSRNLGGLRPRPHDELILRELGPYFDGPWRQHPPRGTRLAQSVQSKASKACVLS